MCNIILIEKRQKQVCSGMEGSAGMKGRVRICFLGCLIVFGLLVTAPSASAVDDLMIRDISAQLPADSYLRLTKKIQETYQAVQAFWRADPALGPAMPIVVELVRPLGKAPTSLFFVRQIDGRHEKVVRVFGGGESSHQLAHKLTSAVFPHRDKLIRNMMGEISEKAFGNPQSFPACGANIDDWVVAMIQSGSYIPLGQIGFRHEDWGMELVNNTPSLKDRPKQNVCYAEAGSFGQFLADTFGKDKLLSLYRQSEPPHRAWQEAFGYSLPELEARWLASLKQKAVGRERQIAALAATWRENPVSACARTQGLR